VKNYVAHYTSLREAWVEDYEKFKGGGREITFKESCNRMSLLANANDEKIDTNGILGFNTDIARTHLIG